MKLQLWNSLAKLFFLLFELFNCIFLTFLQFFQLFNQFILPVWCLNLILYCYLKIVHITLQCSTSFVQLCYCHDLVLYLFFKFSIQFFEVAYLLRILVIHGIWVHFQAIYGKVQLLYLSVELFFNNFQWLYTLVQFSYYTREVCILKLTLLKGLC